MKLSTKIIFSLLVLMMPTVFFLTLYGGVPVSGLLTVISISALVIMVPLLWGLRHFNLFSWLLLASYALGVTVIEWGSSSITREGIVMTLPLLLFFLYWSQENNIFLKEKRRCESRSGALQLDMFLMSSSVLMMGFIMLLIDSNNVDLRGWWPFVLYFSGFYGLVFGLVFGLISAIFLRVNHRRYTVLFSILSFAVLTLSHWLPYYIVLKSGKSISTLTLILGSLILVHFIAANILCIKRKTKTLLK